MVFAYRDDWQQARELVDYAAREVVAAIPPEEPISMDGETAFATVAAAKERHFRSVISSVGCWTRTWRRSIAFDPHIPVSGPLQVANLS